jgi:UDP-N-acetylglucosamine 2-epimerase (non-hydrolysing)
MICTVVGARPNFMKMAPIILELQQRGMPQVFVHTGQHYDAAMSTIFFDELGMPQPDVYLGVGSGSHAEQTARVMIAFEAVCQQVKPSLVIVAGDVNSTLACALTAAKLHIPVAHVEAGLRSFDRDMPEEINRILTDHLAGLLFTTEPSGKEHLLQEGITSEYIHFVGNTMIDSLRSHLDNALKRQPWHAYNLQPHDYGLVTFHRPSNVDDETTRLELATALREISQTLPLLFPMHPRTLAKGEGIWESIRGLKITEPLGYLEFLGLMARARVVITDSGGVQEETTALGVPCVTVRLNTERPITVTQGTNRLVPPIASKIVTAVGNPVQRATAIPEFWDGRASHRLVNVIQSWLRD